MNLLERNLKLITQILLLAVIVIVPFIKTDTLYFPFVSGKAYLLRFLIAIAFFFWVWLMLKGKEYRPDFKNILVVAIPLFFLAQVIASFFGVDPVYSMFSSIERADGVLQYGFWVLYFLMFVSVFRKDWDWKILFSAFVLVAIALSVKSWLDYSAGAQLAGVFGNPSYFAAFLLFAIGFSLITVERKFFNSRWVNYAFLCVAGFFVFTLFFTQTRGVYVALAGAVFLFCTLSILFLRKENKRLVFASAAILLLGLVSLTVLFAAKDTELVQNTRALYRITEVTEIWEQGSTRERVLNWNIALKAFQERPIFGYGPENYASAANKYYDYRIGQGEPWFDRAHNQPMDTLATGGIVVFAAYLFWLGATIFLIYKIAKKRKVLSFLLASMFFAYFLQGFFLFDGLAVYLGLFPFLAFLIFQSYELRIGTPVRQSFSEGGNIRKRDTHESPEPEENQNTSRLHSGHANYKLQTMNYTILISVALLSLFVIYTTTFVPYKANAAAIRFYSYTQNGYYKESRPFLEESFSINSPYTFWEVRKRAGWQFVQVLEFEITEETDPEKLKEIQDLYDFIIPELEKFIEARPHDPQMYYVLGKTYRFGSQKLGRDDLGKAEAVFKKGFVYSDLRIEYFNGFAKVLLLQGRFEEAEQSVKDYVSRVRFSKHFPYVTLGHFYFVAGEYGQALEQYEKAREAGYKFYEVTPEYARYMFVAEDKEEYQKVVDMAGAHLEKWGPDADTYFNIAVGYYNLEDKESAAKFFLRAVALDPAYEAHRSSFLPGS